MKLFFTACCITALGVGGGGAVWTEARCRESSSRKLVKVSRKAGVHI